jgi:hypothetical protein
MSGNNVTIEVNLDELRLPERSPRPMGGDADALDHLSGRDAMAAVRSIWWWRR